MRIFAGVLVVLLAVTWTDASAQRASAPPEAGLNQLLADYSTAEAAGETERAADLAAALLLLDLATTPLAAAGARDLRASLAEALAAAGRTEAAIDALARLASDERDALTSAATPLEASVLRSALIERLRRLAALRLQARQAATALRDLEQALAFSEALYGPESPELRFVLEEVQAARRTAGESTTAEERRLGALAVQEEARGLTSLGGDATASAAEFETLRIFFGSSRMASGQLEPAKAFGGRRSAAGLSYGAVIVTVPKSRALGAIPRPGLLDWQGAKDGVHIVLKRLEQEAGASAFSGRLRGSLAQGNQEAFVYVHGHSESFGDAARRTAQLAVDLDIRNGAIFYAWPAGDLLAYQKSQNEVGVAAGRLAELLRTVSATGATKIHLIAHSMGNRVLLGALEELQRDGGARRFEQLVWASPDEDAELFAQKTQRVAGLAANMTLYASRFDRALQFSRWLGGNYPRAGQAPPLAPVARALTAVDTSRIAAASADLVAHSDYAGGAITDLRALVWLSLAPEARCPLQLKRNRDGSRFWEADPKRPGCDEKAFNRAVSALRLDGPKAPEQVAAFVKQLEIEGSSEAASWREALAIVQRLAAQGVR